MRHHKFLAFLGGAALVAVFIVTPAHAQVLKAVKDRGALNCGVSEGLTGFRSRQQRQLERVRRRYVPGNRRSNLQRCQQSQYVPLDANRRFEALQAGDIDVLSRNTTWTISREVDLGLIFAATNYYDGQGFLIPRSMNKETALDLNGVKVCVQTGTTTELNLADYFRVNSMKYEVIASPNS